MPRTAPLARNRKRQIVVYDGATGQSVGEVPDAHAGSIYSAAFSPGGTRFATASADKTVKVRARSHAPLRTRVD